MYFTGCRGKVKTIIFTRQQNKTIFNGNLSSMLNIAKYACACSSVGRTKVTHSRNSLRNCVLLCPLCRTPRSIVDERSVSVGVGRWFVGCCWVYCPIFCRTPLHHANFFNGTPTLNKFLLKIPASQTYNMQALQKFTLYPFIFTSFGQQKAMKNSRVCYLT